MMIMENLKKILSWKNIKNVIRTVIWSSVVLSIMYAATVWYESHVITQDIKKHTACPSLLSIARSPRDTLIVMKSEPLCNDYVLETLQ
jgi:hypothetical protein